jgi:hypothetical protein
MKLTLNPALYCAAEIVKKNSTTVTCIYKQNCEFTLNVYLNNCLIGRIQPKFEDKTALGHVRNKFIKQYLYTLCNSDLCVKCLSFNTYRERETGLINNSKRVGEEGMSWEK